MSPQEEAANTFRRTGSCNPILRQHDGQPIQVRVTWTSTQDSTFRYVVVGTVRIRNIFDSLQPPCGEFPRKVSCTLPQKRTMCPEFCAWLPKPGTIELGSDNNSCRMPRARLAPTTIYTIVFLLRENQPSYVEAWSVLAESRIRYSTLDHSSDI